MARRTAQAIADKQAQALAAKQKPVIATGAYFEKERATNIITEVDKPILDRSVQDISSLTRTQPTMYDPVIALGGNEPQFSFTPTEQQIRVVAAMEAQKQSEKDQARADSEWQTERSCTTRVGISPG